MAYYSTTSTWYDWTSTATTASASCDPTWSYWVTPSAGTSPSTWVTWTSDSTYYYYVAPAPERAEERLARERRVAEICAEQERQTKIRAEKEKVKEEKARQLLKEVLSEDQDAQLTKDGYFELTSIKSGKRYRIKKGYSMNVEELDAQGKRIRSLCFHPKDQVHHYDNMAIQKLMLENDEEEVRKVANFS